MNEGREKKTNEDILWPSKIDIASIGLSCLWSIAAGFIGGLFTLLLTYIFFGVLQAPNIFPYILSLVGFFAVIITTSMSFILNRLLFAGKYKQWSVILGQISILSIFLFILVTPLYVYINWIKPDFIVFAFLIHVLINILANSLLYIRNFHRIFHYTYPIGRVFYEFFTITKRSLFSHGSDYRYKFCHNPVPTSFWVRLL
jgi:hypothetical protein